MKTKFKEITCPTCKGVGTVQRKGYHSNCAKAFRHLYTNTSGQRVDYCIHCGKKANTR